MPDEIFYMWLEPIAENLGWPFNSPRDSTEDTAWYYILMKAKLDYWVKTKWELSLMDFDAIAFTNLSKFGFNSILQRCEKGRPTIIANLVNCEERFRACADYIRLHNEIPAPIIVLIRNGIEIIDGSHRIAALLHVGIPHGYKIPIWWPTLKNT